MQVNKFTDRGFMRGRFHDLNDYWIINTISVYRASSALLEYWIEC